MKLQRNKTLFAIMLILIMITVGTLITTKQTAALLVAYQYVYANPNPVGIGQTMLIGGWITPLPVYVGNNFIYWTNVSVVISKPDGTTSTFGPITCDPSASYWMNYVPNLVGNYTIATSWNGDCSNPAQAHIYAPTSASLLFTVQQQPIVPWPGAVLPTGYWQRPIYGENRDWSVLGGSWLYEQGAARGGYDQSVSDYQPYSTAPSTAHIDWVIQATQGGIIGGQGTLGTTGAVISSAMYNEQADMIIISGLGYYADHWTYLPSTGGEVTQLGSGFAGTPTATTLVNFVLHCVDIKTGQELWAVPEYTYGTCPSGGTGRTGPMLQGEIEPVPIAAGSGSSGPKAYILGIGTTFIRIDAATGTEMFVMNNSLSGAFDGQYIYSVSNGRLIKWNPNVLANGVNNTVASAAVYNVTAPSVTFGNTTAYLSPSMPSGGIGIASYTVSYSAGLAPGIAGINLATGQLMWNRTLYGYEGGEGTGCTAGGRYFYLAGDGCWHCFDMTTGTELWKSQPGVLPWDKFWGYSVASDGNYLYACCYDGYIYCYNAITGATVWKYFSGNAGLETPYGEWPWFSPPVLADGKLYASNSEHSPTDPNWLGAKLYCFNATTGQVLWTLPWFGGYKAIADGMLIGYNQYDGQLYGFGKGLTATTVMATPKVATSGSSVLIEGTVTDQSPGETCLGIPAAGTPAIADASMSQWMEYLYMQQPKPTNATGVPVTLTALDPNGNTEQIDTVTSDLTGSYAVAWTPPVPGLYTITATLPGSNSYYSSSSETHIAVSKAVAAQPVQTPTQTVTPPPTVTLLPTATPSPQVTTTPVPPPSSAGIPMTYIVIAAVAIIVVVAAAALALRRRK